jgi:hypothetical protein
MKKYFFTFILCIVTLVGGICSANEAVLESPNVSILIDGNKGTYEAVPIIVNKRTLLPFRAVLVNLGVPNDDDHIIWNGEESSVTVIYNTDGNEIKISLKINDNEAMVNDSKEELDVAPMLYNSRTYIPARFIAQSLGKNVDWDGSTSTVYITDGEKYETVKNTLDELNVKMQSIDKCKASGNLQIDMSKDKDITLKTNVQFTTKTDYSQNLMHIDIQANNDLQTTLDISSIVNEFIKEISAQTYLTTKAYYHKYNASHIIINNPPAISSMDIWAKTGYNDDKRDAMFKKNDALKMFLNINDIDMVHSKMAIDEDLSDENTIVLKGNVYPEGVLENITQTHENIQMQLDGNSVVNTAYLEIHIDKNTNLITKANVSLDMIVGFLNQEMKYNVKADYNYDYDYEPKLTLPNELNKL